jgi:uncharacterized protein YbjT (DUF2867 family)
MKNILLFGGTGLIGGEVLRMLPEDNSITINAFLRRPTTLLKTSPYFIPHVVDFNRIEEWHNEIAGDVLFCCLGTTLRKAGSKEVFRQVDYELVVKIAKAASENGVKKFIVISSLGADASSANFYLKTKGEMERDVQQLSFQQIKILRPSILIGNRTEIRLGEKAGILLASVLSPLMLSRLKKYKPISATVVAKAMIMLSGSDSSQVIYESNELRMLSQ